MAVVNATDAPSSEEIMTETSGSDWDSPMDDSAFTWSSEALPSDQGLKIRFRLTTQPMDPALNTGSDRLTTQPMDPALDTGSDRLTNQPMDPALDTGSDRLTTQPMDPALDTGSDRLTTQPMDPALDTGSDRLTTQPMDPALDTGSNRLTTQPMDPALDAGSDETSNSDSGSGRGGSGTDEYISNSGSPNSESPNFESRNNNDGSDDAHNEGDDSRNGRNNDSPGDENSSHENKLCTNNNHGRSNDGPGFSDRYDKNLDLDRNCKKQHVFIGESAGCHEANSSKGSRSLAIQNGPHLEGAHDQDTKSESPTHWGLNLGSGAGRRGSDIHEMDSSHGDHIEADTILTDISDRSNKEKDIYDFGSTAPGSNDTSSRNSDSSSPSLAVQAILQYPIPKNASPDFDGFNMARRGSNGDAASGSLKRPLNAYMLWSMERRRQMKTDFPDLSVTEVCRRMGAEWRGMSEAQKNFFNERSRDLKEKFLVENPDYKFERRSKKAKRSKDEAANSHAISRDSQVIPLPADAAAVRRSNELVRVVNPEPAANPGPGAGVASTSSDSNGESSPSREASPVEPQRSLHEGIAGTTTVDPVWRSWIENAHRLRQYSVFAVPTPREISITGTDENPTPGTSGDEARSLPTLTGSQTGVAGEVQVDPCTTNQPSPTWETSQSDLDGNHLPDDPGYSGQYANHVTLLPISSFLSSFDINRNIFAFGNTVGAQSMHGYLRQNRSSPTVIQSVLDGGLDQMNALHLSYQGQIFSEGLCEPGSSQETSHHSRFIDEAQNNQSRSPHSQDLAATSQHGPSATTAGGSQGGCRGHLDPEYEDLFSQISSKGRDEVSKLSDLLDTVQTSQYRVATTAPQPGQVTAAYRSPYLVAPDAVWSPQGASAYGSQFGLATTTGTYPNQIWNEVLQGMADPSQRRLATTLSPSNPSTSWYSNQFGHPDLLPQWAVPGGEYPSKDEQTASSRQSAIGGKHSPSAPAIDLGSLNRTQCTQTPIYYPPAARVIQPRYGSAFGYVTKQGADSPRSL